MTTETSPPHHNLFVPVESGEHGYGATHNHHDGSSSHESGHDHDHGLSPRVRKAAVAANLGIMMAGGLGNLGFTRLPDVLGAAGLTVPAQFQGENGAGVADGMHNGADAAMYALHGRNKKWLYRGLSLSSAATAIKASVDFVKGLAGSRAETLPTHLGVTAAIGSLAISSALLWASLRPKEQRSPDERIDIQPSPPESQLQESPRARRRLRSGSDFIDHVAGDVASAAIAVGGMALQYNNLSPVASATTVGVSSWMLWRFRPTAQNLVEAAHGPEEESEPSLRPRFTRQPKYHGRHRRRDAPEYESWFLTRSRRRRLGVWAVAAGLLAAGLSTGGQQAQTEPHPNTAAQVEAAQDNLGRQLDRPPQLGGDALAGLGGKLELKPALPPQVETALTVHVQPRWGWFDVFKALDINVVQWDGLLTAAGPKLQGDNLAYFDKQAHEFRVSQPGDLPADTANDLRLQAAYLAGDRTLAPA